MTEQSSGSSRLDTRTRFFIVFLLSITAFFMNKAITAHLMVLIAAVILFTARRYRICLIYAAVYALIAFAMIHIEQVTNQSAMLTLITLSYFVQKIIVTLMMGTYLFSTTSVTEAVCAMETMHAPRQITVPFAVAMRFFPSIREDYHSLKESLKIRRIGVTAGDYFAHPVKTIEYILVPILIRSYKTSDELAASAMVRGLDSGRVKTILYPLRFRAVDYISWALVMAIAGALFWVQYN